LLRSKQTAIGRETQRPDERILLFPQSVPPRAGVGIEEEHLAAIFHGDEFAVWREDEVGMLTLYPEASRSQAGEDIPRQRVAVEVSSSDLAL
jgi:hypothetical protein